MHDESYVQEILKAMPEGLSLEQFLARCAQDLAAGYRQEVEEAAWRYFAPRLLG
jgi:hypothetical protein